jgi:ABC-type multidrug transport system ATPase subunit
MLTDADKLQRINDLMNRLGLESCQNTRVGDHVIKGCSGGERKRTSIGYELITNPNLLFLDEPTSGLDSNTAQRIIEMLKKECKNYNITMIATIHQPSS